MSLVEHFADVVASVQTSVLADLQAVNPNITGVHYSYGHLLEIVNKMKLWSQSETLRLNKFPRIMLVEDIPIAKGSNEFDSATLHIIIVMSTKPEYESSQRQSIVFDPILNPIYEALLEALYEDPYFVVSNPLTDLPDVVYDRKYWGKSGVYENTANIFNDYLDAKEIMGLRIKINIPDC